MGREEKGFSNENLLKNYPRVAEIPFDSERKCMTTFHKTPEKGFISFTKGAIEVLLERSTNELTTNGKSSIDKEKIHVGSIPNKRKSKFPAQFISANDLIKTKD